MKEKSTGKKFLYSDQKKLRDGEEVRTFHSRGFDPSDSPHKGIIDLDSVWSVKNVSLDGKSSKRTEAMPGLSITPTNYYSRYGKTSVGKDLTQTTQTSKPDWKRKSYEPNTGVNNSKQDPLDF